MPYKVCPFLATHFWSSNLHLCSILRSRDGSCYKVKIIAVILGEPTQTDNSWHRCSPQRILPGWTGAIPVKNLLFPDWGYFFSVYTHSMSFLLQVSLESSSSWPWPLLSPFVLTIISYYYTFYREIPLLHGDTLLDPGPYAMSGDYNNNTMESLLCTSIISFGLWNNPITYVLLLSHFQTQRG